MTGQWPIYLLRTYLGAFELNRPEKPKPACAGGLTKPNEAHL